jgi:tetratricopeptide (TPR) repeat protein
MGEIRSALGQVVEALQEYKWALQLFRQTTQLDRVVEALNNMGVMHRWQQHYSEARACYQEALRICEEAPILIIQKGTTFNNLGRLTLDQGKQAAQARNSKQANIYYHEALDYYEQALVYYQENGLSRERTLTLNNIGEIYQILGEMERAQKYYWRALQLFQEQENRRGEGMALNDLGSLYHKLAQGTNRIYIKEARTCCKEALCIFREVGDRRQEITVLRNLGRFCLTDSHLAIQQRYRQSLACFLVAKKIAIFGQNTRIPAWVEDTIRRDLAHLGVQSYEQFLQEVEAQAEQIVEDMLH